MFTIKWITMYKCDIRSKKYLLDNFDFIVVEKVDDKMNYVEHNSEEINSFVSKVEMD